MTQTREEGITALLQEVRAAEVRMDQLRGQMQIMADWRAQSLLKLREHLSAAEIAARLGVTRQAVYAALREPPPDDLAGLWASGEIGRQHPEHDAQAVRERLAVHARQLKNVADGRTPKIPLSEVGARFLYDDLCEAIAALA